MIHADCALIVSRFGDYGLDLRLLPEEADSKTVAKRQRQLRILTARQNHQVSVRGLRRTSKHDTLTTKGHMLHIGYHGEDKFEKSHSTRSNAIKSIARPALRTGASKSSPIVPYTTTLQLTHASLQHHGQDRILTRRLPLSYNECCLLSPTHNHPLSTRILKSQRGRRRDHIPTSVACAGPKNSR